MNKNINLNIHIQSVLSTASIFFKHGDFLLIVNIFHL